MKKTSLKIIRNKEWFDAHYNKIERAGNQTEAFLFQLLVAYFDKEITLTDLLHFLKKIYIEKQEFIHKSVNSFLKKIINYPQRGKINKEEINSLLQNLLDLISFPEKNIKQKIVISVGGSLIVNGEGINLPFLHDFNYFIRHQLAMNTNLQFFLVIGGGKTGEIYREAGKSVVGHDLSGEDIDWLGIHTTRLNAFLIKTIFQDIAHPTIIQDYDVILKPDEPVVVAAGWKPGWSTDYCATLLAEDYEVKRIINLKTISQIYNKDPRKFTDAQPERRLSWADYRHIVGDAWIPGMSTPFDPIAAQNAEKLALTVALLHGNNFDNITRYLEGDRFLGTIIS